MLSERNEKWKMKMFVCFVKWGILQKQPRELGENFRIIRFSRRSYSQERIFCIASSKLSKKWKLEILQLLKLCFNKLISNALANKSWKFELICSSRKKSYWTFVFSKNSYIFGATVLCLVFIKTRIFKVLLWLKNDATNRLHKSISRKVYCSCLVRCFRYLSLQIFLPQHVRAISSSPLRYQWRTPFSVLVLSY